MGRLAHPQAGWFARAVTRSGSPAAMVAGLARTTRLEDAPLLRTRQRQIQRTARAGAAGRLVAALRSGSQPPNGSPRGLHEGEIAIALGIELSTTNSVIAAIQQ